MGLVTGPHARTPPDPQPVGSGPRQPAQRASSRGWKSARPQTPHTQARDAPPGHPHAPPTARKSARCAVGAGSPRPHPPRTNSQLVVGPGSPPRGRAVGGGGAPDPGRPTPRQEAPPPGTLMPPPQHARECAVGLVTGPHARTPPHPQPVGSGPRQPAQRAGSQGSGERPTPDAPHPGRRRPPRAPSCRPHSAQSQLARARAVGLMTGPQSRTPSNPEPVSSGPRQPAQRAGSQGWESARPRTPHTQAGGAPPGHPLAAPQRAKPARKSARCGVGDGSPRPHPPAPTASG